ncbi:glutamate receptor ionotropic, NMDA 1-like [Clytia hemisphaerica]
MRILKMFYILSFVILNVTFSWELGMKSFGIISPCQQNRSSSGNFTNNSSNQWPITNLPNLSEAAITTTSNSILRYVIEKSIRIAPSSSSATNFILYVNTDGKLNEKHDNNKVREEIFKRRHNQDFQEIYFHISLKILLYDIEWLEKFVESLVQLLKSLLVIVLNVGYFLTELIVGRFSSNLLNHPRVIWISRHAELKTGGFLFRYGLVLEYGHQCLGNLIKSYHFVWRNRKKDTEILQIQIDKNQTVIKARKNNENQNFFKHPIKDIPTLKIITLMSGDVFMYQRHDFFNEATQNCDGSKTHLCKQPIVTATGTVGGWELTCCAGFLIDLLNDVKNDVKFEADLEISPNFIFGGYNETSNTFNGLIGAVNSSHYDLALASVTVTEQRSRFVDFSHPYVDVEIGMLMDSAALKNSIWSYFQFNFIANLDPFVFLSFCGLYCVSFAILGFTEYYIAKEKKQSCLILRGRRTRLRRNIFLETVAYLNRLAFGHDSGGKEPITYAGRMIAGTLAAAYITIISLYTASLTVGQVQMKNDLSDISLDSEVFANPTPDFKFATLKDSSTEGFFKNSELPKLRKMYEFMKDYSYSDNKDGLGRLENKELQAVIEESLVYKHSSIACNLDIHNLKFGSSGWSFVLQKNSPWTDGISESIMRLSEQGRLAELRKKWVNFKCVPNNKVESYSFHFFAMPFLCLAAMFVCCLLTTWLQKLYYNSNLSRKNTFQPDISYVMDDPATECDANTRTLNIPSNSWQDAKKAQSTFSLTTRRVATVFETNTNRRKRSRTHTIESTC